MENQKVQGVAHTTTTTTNPRAFHHYNGSAYGGREDCWTEGATGVLIEAWGNRYLELNRGNLRQKDWKEVADSVNIYHVKQGIKNFSRTDIQCKNRIDTIKKKYKSVKSKPNPSQWPFFERLHSLIGANFAPVNKKLASSSSSPQPIHYRPPGMKNPNPNLVMYSGGGMSKKARLDEGEYSDSSEGEGEDEYDDSEGDEEGREEEVEEEAEELERSGGRKRRGGGEDGGGVGEGYRELAKAVVKFGEMYERIECSKQQQMMELEKQRMEFTKEIEFQRMQMFMDAQLKVEKRKRPKHSSSASNGGESLGFDPLLFFSLSSFQF
ncbi:trihelix transcription factor ASIL2-like [Papaver somniferum]|uniref:trihelix transcription factor ASIL2-like n=1 Tax=Papaver somniferum TaxID=3469 RepID=UPI000E6FB45D|nr:trihelix transcription factor ASIL2-like [Papaver somniferum]